MTDTLLWTTDSLVAALGDVAGRPHAGGIEGITGVSIDSRTLAPGDLFIALVGPTNDGHDYLQAAFDGGAALAIVDRPLDELSVGERDAHRLIEVTDSMEALNRIGSAGRKRSPASIIAVTGSVGKTGVKAALAHALGESGPTHASAFSYNNHWGVPLSLARMSGDAQYGVFEVGMNRPGELGPLASRIAPHIAAITRIAPAHMEAFASLDDIAAAKAEVFEGLLEGGTAILNRDDPYFDYLSGRARDEGAGKVIGFGASESSDVRLEDKALHQGFSCVRANVGGKVVTYRIDAGGEHWVMNSLAVLACVQAVGADLARAALSLAGFSPPAGRGTEEVLSFAGRSFTVVDESYNANPASMHAAIANLGDHDTNGHGRRIAVLGDMLELGDESAAYHLSLADALKEAEVDLTFGCGPLTRGLIESLPKARVGAWTEKAEEIGGLLESAIEDGDVVMIKGSRGMGLDRVVSRLRARSSLENGEVT